MLELIWNNVRWPEGVKIDNYALMAALKVAENRIVAMLDKYGRDSVMDCVEEMLDRMETSVRGQLDGRPGRHLLGRVVDGRRRHGPRRERHRPLRRDDQGRRAHPRLLAAATGCARASSTAPTRRPISRAVAGSFLYFDPALADFHNEGSMRPITVIAPEGTVVNATYPATVGGSPVNVGTQVLEATVNALSKAMPDKAIAGWGRRRGHYLAGVDPRTGERYVQTTTDADGGSGAVCGLRRLRGRDGHVRPGLDPPRQRRGDRDPLPVADGQVALPARPVRRRSMAWRLGHALGGREPGRRRRAPRRARPTAT